jgi:SUF system NifU family Fe-S assembly protein
MTQLDQLYREVIMEHYRNPRRKGLLDDPLFHTKHIKNPSCGDDITIQTKVQGDQIEDCRHDGHGCSICCASASVLCETMEGKPVSEARRLAQTYLAMVGNQPYDETVDLEEAAAFYGVRQFPARVKCASIAWKAFLDTLEQ